jgi:hypothetical protein
MANWSYSRVELKGHFIDLQKFIFNISPFLSGPENSILTVPDSDDFDNGFANEFSYTLDLDNNSLVIHMFGKWVAPEKFISFFVSKNNLTGSFSDSESSNSFFSLINYENGVIIDRIHTNYISKESILFFGLDHFIDEYFEHMFEIIHDLTLDGVLVSQKILKDCYPFNDFFYSGVPFDLIQNKMTLFEQ